MERGGQKAEEEERMNKEESSPFTPFFYPGNIAVIGVSPDKTNLGKNIVPNCLTLGFGGEILPVGRSGGVTFGRSHGGASGEAFATSGGLSDDSGN